VSDTLLPEPMEFLDLAHGNTATIRVERFLDGSAVIHPRAPTANHVRTFMSQNGLTEPPQSGTPISVEVPVLRLYGARLDKPSPVKYLDVSSKTLRADLLARFNTGLALPVQITLSANGHAPHKRYSVETSAA
jgi:hypothetical protein